MEKPRISAEELAQKLVNSRKIMKKVDTGDYEKGNINEKLIKSSPEELLTENAPLSQTSKRPIGNVDPNKINQSKLPDAIKKAMIENPITLDDSLDMNFVNNAKRLMEEDNSLISMGKQGSKQQSRQISESSLEKLIESTIRRVLDEKLTQILNAEQAVSINENLVIKVGDSLFSGKITKVKNTK